MIFMLDHLDIVWIYLSIFNLIDRCIALKKYQLVILQPKFWMFLLGTKKTNLAFAIIFSQIKSSLWTANYSVSHLYCSLSLCLFFTTLLNHEILREIASYVVYFLLTGRRLYHKSLFLNIYSTELF